MPYIPKDSRNKIESDILAKGSVGQLNYAISRLLHDWLSAAPNFGYHHFNAVIGVLECVKLELYRQIAAPYEREKHKLNGPVSELDHDGQ